MKKGDSFFSISFEKSYIPSVKLKIQKSMAVS